MHYSRCRDEWTGISGKVPAVQLTGPLDGDFELSSAGSFGVNLKVCSLLHPQALWLKTTTLSSAEAGVTRCGETHTMKRVRENQTERAAFNTLTPTLWPHVSSAGRRGMRCGMNDMKPKLFPPERYIHQFQGGWWITGKPSVLFNCPFLLPCTPLLCRLSIYLILQSEFIDRSKGSKPLSSHMKWSILPISLFKMYKIGGAESWLDALQEAKETMQGQRHKIFSKEWT